MELRVGGRQVWVIWSHARTHIPEHQSRAYDRYGNFFGRQSITAHAIQTSETSNRPVMVYRADSQPQEPHPWLCQLEKGVTSIVQQKRR